MCMHMHMHMHMQSSAELNMYNMLGLRTKFKGGVNQGVPQVSRGGTHAGFLEFGGSRGWLAGL